MFFFRKKKSEPTSAARLKARMHSIGEDAATIAGMIRAGKSMPSVHFQNSLDGPVRSPDTESLFQQSRADGEKDVVLFHYTSNFRSQDVMAQVDLMNFFGDVIRANCILSAVAGRVVTFEGGNAISGLLDQIMVSAASFEAYFDRAELSEQAATGDMRDSALKKKSDALAAISRKRFEQVRADLFRPDMLEQFVPMQGAPFVSVKIGPPKEGQKFINGVHFPAELADAVTSLAARRQAESMGNRPKARFQ